MTWTAKGWRKELGVRLNRLFVSAGKRLIRVAAGDLPVTQPIIPTAQNSAAVDYVISRNEILGRALVQPTHIAKTSEMPKAGSLKPRRGTAELSVFRPHLARVSPVRRHLLATNPDPKKVFRGVWVFAAQPALEDGGLFVLDSREEYTGHAHVIFPHVTPANDDPHVDPGVVADMKRATNSLERNGRFISDLEPQAPTWTQPEIDSIPQ